MSVVGVSPGSPESVSPRAVQPVAIYNPSTGAPNTLQTVNADGSTNVGGSNGTARATAANPLNAAVNGLNGTGIATAANPFPVQAAGVTSTAVSSATNPLATSDTPNSLTTSAPTSAQTTVAAGSLIAKASAGNCYGFNVVAGASAGYFMLFNSTTVPADGTVTPLKCYAVAANASLGVHWDVPRRFGTGIVGVFSTTGPFTKTISATAFIGIDYV